MYAEKILLNGIWNLYIEENSVCRAFAEDITREEQLKENGISAIAGDVPGNFELDMQKAGLIADPYFGANPLEIQKLENRHLWYSRSFEYKGNSPEKAYLLFEGIDTFAVENPVLWWPRDMGEQKLYSVKAVLSFKGQVVDAKEFNCET